MQPPDRSSWPRRLLDPPVLSPLGDTKLRHVRKQTQLHPHEGSLLRRGGPIQVRWGGPIPHPAGRDPPQGRATTWPPPPCAQHRSSPPQVPLRALPAVPRHAVVPRQRGVLGRCVSPPNLVPSLPGIRRACGTLRVCVRPCRPSGRPSLLWYCTVCVY